MKRNVMAILLLMATTTICAQDFDFNEVTYTPEKTVFRLFAPKKSKSVALRIYDKDYVQGDKCVRAYKMKYSSKGNFWETTVKGDLKGKYYTFDVADYAKWAMTHADNSLPEDFNGETPGVFAKAVGINGKRGYILDLKDTNPAGWENDKRPEVKSPADLIIYELHHRDFSIARNINKTPSYPPLKDGQDAPVRVKRVASDYPGKFLALTEPWAVGHLKELGVNAIHILPSYDFGSVDETKLSRPQYNWGYDPVNYNVPEGSYSTDPTDPACRIREFKQMVQALHKAGIKVILDVVYNHTYNIENSNFQRTYPDYYYRKTPNGAYSNGSGCGNETASEMPMMRRFMIESVKYWINEYHIDGLRFDLMGVHDMETMNAIRKAVDEIDPAIFIYGEGWSAGECAYPQDELGTKAHVSQMPRIAAFSDEIRDALRGPFSDDTKGAFLAGIPGNEESLKFGIVGAIQHSQVDMAKVNYSKTAWAAEPTQMISYVSCHDDMCLADRLIASVPDISLDELIRLDLLAQTAVFTSQGVPFMLSGEELLRTKQGVHNSFESPDSINQLDWSARHRYPQVFAYYKNLIQLRKNHPAFRLGRAELVRKHLEFLPVADNLVGFRLKNHAGGDQWNNIIVIFNSNREACQVPVPQGRYTVVCCDGVINEDGIETVETNEVTVDPQSALIIHD